MIKNIRSLLTTFVLACIAVMAAQANGLLEVSSSNAVRLMVPSSTSIHTIIRDQVATTVHVFTHDLTDTVPMRLRFGMGIGAGVTMTSLRYRVDSVWRLAVSRRERPSRKVH